MCEESVVHVLLGHLWVATERSLLVVSEKKWKNYESQHDRISSVKVVLDQSSGDRIAFKQSLGSLENLAGDMLETIDLFAVVETSVGIAH